MPFWEPQGLQLECLPPVAPHIAQPWDAADQYLLEHIDRDALTLVINDRYGALTCALTSPVGWLESAAAHDAISQNLARNSKSPLIAWAAPEECQNPDLKQVVLRIPKNLDQLKYWLQLCQQQLPSDTVYWLAGMAKHIPISWLNWLEQNADEYRQYPVERKARLLRLTSPSPDTSLKIWSGYHLEQPAAIFEALPGVFSRHSLDIGSRFLIDNLHSIRIGKTVCDLGCGNGLLAICIGKLHPDSHLILTDESLSAVKSARRNLELNQIGQAEVRHGSILSAVPEQLDTIVCNPPFHDGHKQLADIALDMFRQASRQLNPDGMLVVIANNHLPYRPALQKLFDQVRISARNTRFNIYTCTGPRRKS